MTTDRRSGSESAGRAALSRRAFLAAGGATVGTGLVGTANADEGVASASGPVAAREPYRTAVARTLDSGRAESPAAFGDSADILVSGRPTEDGGTVRGVVADAVATLATGSETWRECLAPSAVARRWASDGPVETWSEATATLDPARASDGTEAGDGGQILVRGTRSAQYASGHGGVGYYDVAPEEVSGGADGDSSAPLARVAYVHEAAAGDATAFLGRYRQRVGVVEAVDDLFVDPSATE